MAKVVAPNKAYCGISAGVTFVDGEGQCDDKRLLDWFETRGYLVEREEKVKAAKKGK